MAAAETAPDVSKVGIEKVKSWSLERVKKTEADYRASGLQRRASPGFWGDQVIYQIQVDRFNNGDTSNDKLNIEPNQERGDLRGILDFRHGGDLKGITKRLDYIRDFGITSLWLTPFLKHNGSYHGYCTTDPTQVDPGFGTNEDFRELVKQAHARGISVIVDVVINHLCDNATDYSKQPDHYRCSDELNANNWSGRPGGSAGQGELKFASSFFGPLKSQHFFNRCGANSQSDMEGTGPAAVYGDFVKGMFDFDTRNHDFQVIFTNLFKNWIAYADVDGFRLDAAKHVSEDFVAYFSTEIRDYARSVGKQNFFVVGEVAGPSDWIGRRLGKMYSNPANPNDRGTVPQTLTNRLWELKPKYEAHPTSKYPGLTAAYDFAHGGTALSVIYNQRPPKALEEHFTGGYFNDVAGQNDYRLSWTLLEIHDWPRAASLNKSSMEKSALGIAYLAMAEGSPIIYYGQEQGFNGDCHSDKMNAGPANGAIDSACHGHSHALFRQDMFMGGMTRLGSTVPEINKLAYIGPSQKFEGANDPYLNRDHALFKTARKFLNVRHSCNALKYGSTAFRWVEQGASEGILAFSRINQNGPHTYEALVVINTSWSEREIPEMKVNDGSSGKQWKNLMNGFQQGTTTGRGSLHFGGLKIGPNSAMVFVPSDNVAPFDPRLEAHRCVN